MEHLEMCLSQLAYWSICKKKKNPKNYFMFQWHLGWGKWDVNLEKTNI